MKIKHLKASLHHMPIELPGINAPLENRRFVFCEVETDEGIKGFGITGQFVPFATIAALEQHILPVVKNLDPRDTEKIHARVWSKLNPRGMTGVVQHALSALDIALWDIRGKKEGRTVAGLMGGHKTSTPVYVTFGYPYFDHDQLVEYARKFVADGHDCLKMVVAQSKGGWKEDAKRIRVVRDAIGDDVELLIDANNMFSPEEARLLCRAVEECNLTWFEEPLYVNDTRAMHDLRRNTSIPLAAGQMEGHRWRLRDLVLDQAVDFLQPNVCYNGGYTETLKVCHMAQAFNLPIHNGGGWPIFNMHTMAGLMNGGRVEFHYGMWQAGKEFFIGTPDPEGNKLTIPDRLGLGFEPNYDKLEESVLSESKGYTAEDRDALGYLQRK